MAITIHQTRQIELVPARPRRGQLPRQYRPVRTADSLSVPALKTGLLGGCAYLLLFVIGLNPLFENLAYIFPAVLVILGFSAVGPGTGLPGSHVSAILGTAGALLFIKLDRNRFYRK